MRARLKIILIVILGGCIFSGCSDQNGVFDRNKEIENHNWSYVNKVGFAVQINDPSVFYNIYFNLRVTGDYKYSNMYVLLHRSGPGLKPTVTRFQVKLAKDDGEWLGSGSGNLYNYQVPFFNNYKFPAKGVYHFDFEQNMRDNPLQEVSDVGLRVEKAE
jgi:gliding motility-associated lipoprotein GldH